MREKRIGRVAALLIEGHVIMPYRPSFRCSPLVTKREFRGTGGSVVAKASLGEAADYCRREGGRLLTSEEWEFAWEFLDTGEWEWTSTVSPDGLAIIRGGVWTYDRPAGVRPASRQGLDINGAPRDLAFRVAWDNE